jgi:hypothetical protein
MMDANGPDVVMGTCAQITVFGSRMSRSGD